MKSSQTQNAQVAWLMEAAKCRTLPDPSFLLDHKKWANILNYAQRVSCVLPLLVGIDRAPWRGRLPIHILENAESVLRQERMKLALLDIELDCASGALDRAGLPFIILKGMDLGRRVYPDRIFRAMSDVDLLVEPPCYDQAIEALHAADFKIIGEQRTSRNCIEMGRTPGGPVVELHRALQAGDSDARTSELWRRSMIVSLPGLNRPARVLCDEDQLIYLIRHACIQHCLESPVWLTDIHFLIASSEFAPQMDWQRVIAQFFQHRIVSAAYFTLTTLSEEWGTVLPPFVLTELGLLVGKFKSRRLRHMAHTQAWFPFPPRSSISTAFRRVLLRDGFQDVWTYTRRKLSAQLPKISS